MITLFRRHLFKGSLYGPSVFTPAGRAAAQPSASRARRNPWSSNYVRDGGLARRLCRHRVRGLDVISGPCWRGSLKGEADCGSIATYVANLWRDAPSGSADGKF